MKIGDMVIRKVGKDWSLSDNEAKRHREALGLGIVLSKEMGGSNPPHPCITVFYSKVGRKYSIAESLMEVISEGQ